MPRIILVCRLRMREDLQKIYDLRAQLEPHLGQLCDEIGECVCWPQLWLKPTVLLHPIRKQLLGDVGVWQSLDNLGVVPSQQAVFVHPQPQ